MEISGQDYAKSTFGADKWKWVDGICNIVIATKPLTLRFPATLWIKASTSLSIWRLLSIKNCHPFDSSKSGWIEMYRSGCEVDRNLLFYYSWSLLYCLTLLYLIQIILSSRCRLSGLRNWWGLIFFIKKRGEIIWLPHIHNNQKLI